jgi:hypothetical protein
MAEGGVTWALRTMAGAYYGLDGSWLQDPKALRRTWTSPVEARRVLYTAWPEEAANRTKHVVRLTRKGPFYTQAYVDRAVLGERIACVMDCSLLAPDFREQNLADKDFYRGIAACVKVLRARGIPA